VVLVDGVEEGTEEITLTASAIEKDGVMMARIINGGGRGGGGNREASGR
jgi:hypothetical protein